MTLEHGTLRELSAEYVAGDLDPETRDRFESVLETDVELQGEVAFWTTMRERLPVQGRPPARAPGPGFNQALRRRLDRERALAERRNVVAFPRWVPGAAAAIAAGLLLAFGLDLVDREVRPDEIAWAEDGSSVVAATDEGRMPLSRVGLVSHRTVLEHETRIGVWAGLYTHPVRLSGVGGDQASGLQVVRLVHEGPAWHSGLRPGDVILAVNQRQICTPSCMTKAFSGQNPGDRVGLSFYRPSSRETLEADLQLGAYVE